MLVHQRISLSRPMFMLILLIVYSSLFLLFFTYFFLTQCPKTRGIAPLHNTVSGPIRPNRSLHSAHPQTASPPTASAKPCDAHDKPKMSPRQTPAKLRMGSRVCQKEKWTA